MVLPSQLAFTDQREKMIVVGALREFMGYADQSAHMEYRQETYSLEMGAFWYIDDDGAFKEARLGKKAVSYLYGLAENTWSVEMNTKVELLREMAENAKFSSEHHVTVISSWWVDGKGAFGVVEPFKGLVRKALRLDEQWEQWGQEQRQ